MFAHYSMQAMSPVGKHTLDDLFAVANTLHGRDAHAHLESGVDLAPGERHDHLASAAAARIFLSAQGMRLPATDPTPAELRALGVVRASVHALARRGTAATPALRRLLRRHRYRLDGSGTLRPEGRGWPALIAELLLLLGDARIVGNRLKRCANRDCGWVFVDASKNQSRHWCEMRTCGNRANLRRYRARLRHPQSATRRARS
jgi:predicted RNA-binding Zn ribbon-like protein